MEAAECHVLLHMALSQSGLLDKLNHFQKNKMCQVHQLSVLHTWTVVNVHDAHTHYRKY